MSRDFLTVSHSREIGTKITPITWTPVGRLSVLRDSACSRRPVLACLALQIGAKGPPLSFDHHCTLLVHSHHDGPLTHDTRMIDPFRTSL